METTAYDVEKARQCRRLLRTTIDRRTNQGLTAMAEEFGAQAEAAAHTVDLLGDGAPGRSRAGGRRLLLVKVVVHGRNGDTMPP